MMREIQWKKFFNGFLIFSLLLSQFPLSALLGQVTYAAAGDDTCNGGDATITAPTSASYLSGTSTVSWTFAGADCQTVDAALMKAWAATGTISSGTNRIALTEAANEFSTSITFNSSGGSTPDGSNYSFRLKPEGIAFIIDTTSWSNVIIDNTPPTISIDDNASGTPTQSDTISVSVSDATAGIAETKWIVSDNATCDATKDASINTGTAGITMNANNDTTYLNKYICFRATDNAGQKNYAVSNQITMLDTTLPTAPVISTPITATGNDITPNIGITVAETGTSIRIYSGGVLFQTVASPLSGANTVTLDSVGEGAHANFTATFSDLAGNESTATTIATFMVDVTKPVVASVVATPDPSAAGVVSVVVTFTEAGAGIDTAIAPIVALVDGTGYVVTASGAAGHTNGYIDATPTIWEGTIDVTGRTDGSLNYSVTGATDLAGNVMDDNLTAGTGVVDEVGPAFVVNTGVDAGPVQTDTINVTVSDVTTSVASSEYGYSADGTCDVSDTYGNVFTGDLDFSITGNHTDRLCLKAVDAAGNITYNLVGTLNTDNTAPAILSTTLLSPNGGESWTGGSIHSITWTDGDITDTNLGGTPITLAYGATTGGTWTEIAASEVNDGTYAWTLPAINSGNVFVRITATDAAGNTSEDSSDASLTIDSAAPATAITSPAEGAIVALTETITATGTDNFAVASVVFYYNNTNDTVTPTLMGTDSSSPYTTGLDTTALADGTWYLYTVATDTAGNTTTSTIISIVVDNTLPAISNLNFPEEASSSAELVGLATHNSLTVTQVEYFIDATGANDAGTDLALGSGTTSRTFSGTIDVSALSGGQHTLYVHAKNSESVWGSTYTTITFTKTTSSDTTAPVVTFNPSSLSSLYTVSAITAVSFSGTSDEDGTLYINGVSQGAVTSGSARAVVLGTGIGAHSYQIKVVDAAGNNSLTHSFTYQVEANDTTAPTIEYTPIANQFNVSAVPASIIFTIGDDVLVTTLTLQHGGVPTSVFSALSGGTYTLALANTVGLHEYTLTAGDAVGNTTSKTVTYNVVADTVTNINISGFTVSNLGSTGVTVAWTTSETSADSKVDFYANGSQLLNQTATVSGSVNSLTVSTLLANKSYTVIIKSRVTGQTNYTTLSFIINTAASANGIVVHSVERILDGSTPTAGGGYASGYHFRFQVTINNLSKSSVSFKLADWSNSVATMAVASNTKFVWSADGVDSHTEGTILGSLSAADTYASANNVSTVDGDSGVGGRQLVLDMFYQIPTGAQGVFSTSYGIKAE